jgi:TP901 family phage tail tape measure protein
MADTKSTIELIFEGVDKTSAATKSALANTSKFSQGVSSATQPIADFTGSALKLEAAIIASGIAITAFSISLASDFQSAVADLSKVLSDTDDIEQYKNLAVELSQEYGVAALDVLGAITNYKQAGFTAKEAGELTKAGLDLVIAGSVEAAQGADLLVASIKGFGAEAGDASIIVDLLNQVSNEYAASTGQLLEGFAQLSPVAQAAGLSLEETIGILTPGIEVFQSGSEVAQALKTSLLRLLDDSKPVQEGLEALGVSQFKTNGELRSARDIYFDVAAALGGVDDSQKLFIASQLVGINQSAKFIAITDGLDTTLRIAGDGFEFLGSAAKEVAVQLATAEKAGDRAKQSFVNLFVGIGTPILDEFTGVADALAAIFQAIGDSATSGDSGIATLVSYIEGEFSGLQEVLEEVAKNLPAALELADFSGFTNGVTVVSDAIKNLFEGVDLSSAEGLAAAITGIGTAFEALSEFSGGVIDSFKPLFEKILEVAGGLKDLDGVTFETLGNMAGFATQANILAKGLNSLLGPVEALVYILAAKNGLGLASALLATTANASKLVGVLGSAGLVAAAGAAGFALGDFLNKASEDLTGTSISTFLVDTVAGMGLLDDAAGDLVDGLNDLPFAGLGKDVENAAVALSGYEEVINQVGDKTDDATDSGWKFADSMGGVATGVAEVGQEGIGEIRDLSEAILVAGESAQDLDAAGQSLGGTLSFVGTQASEAAEKTKSWSQVVEELSIEEKLALIDAQSEITTARIDADAKKTVAAYESITVSIESTGEAITSMFGLLGDDSISKLDKLDISSQIEKENELREKTFELQAKLTEAQIKALEAQAAALTNGDPLITVNGDGLAPHLQAIMFEVLDAIQIQVNADGYGLLLGQP